MIVTFSKELPLDVPQLVPKLIEAEWRIYTVLSSTHSNSEKYYTSTQYWFLLSGLQFHHNYSLLGVKNMQSVIPQC